MIGLVLCITGGLLVTFPGALAFDCNVTVFDEVSSRAVFFGAGPKEAQNEEELKVRCDMFDKDIAYLQEYTKNCIRGLANGMVKLVLEGASNDMATRCTPSPTKDVYLNVVPCFVKHGDALHKCNRDFAAFLESANSKPKKNRVPLSCCYMGAFRECISKTVKQCGPEHQTVATQIINNYAADLLSTVCVKWKFGSKACKDLPKISQVTSPKYKSLIAPLADVLASLNR